MPRRLAASLAIAALGLAGCQTMTAPRPAVLVSDDAASMALLKDAISEHLGRAKVELGAGDLTAQSMISVLPPRVTAIEGNSVAMPRTLELRVRDTDCYIYDEAERRATMVRDLKCRPLE